jgi:DNA-binding NtrC family response regulator
MSQEIQFPGQDGKDLKTLIGDYERSLILAALADSGGNQRRAAAALGILPTTLHEKMKRLGLKQRPASQALPVS